MGKISELDIDRQMIEQIRFVTINNTFLLDVSDCWALTQEIAMLDRELEALRNGN